MKHIKVDGITKDPETMVADGLSSEELEEYRKATKIMNGPWSSEGPELGMGRLGPGELIGEVDIF